MQLKINNYQVDRKYYNNLVNYVEKTNQNNNQQKSENVTPTRKKDELILSTQALELLKAENNKNVINPGDSKFKPLFERFGIDTTKDVSLLVYSDGKIEVTNSHPDKSKIETLLNQDNELSSAIRSSLGIAIYNKKKQEA